MSRINRFNEFRQLGHHHELWPIIRCRFLGDLFSVGGIGSGPNVRRQFHAKILLCRHHTLEGFWGGFRYTFTKRYICGVAGHLKRSTLRRHARRLAFTAPRKRIQFGAVTVFGNFFRERLRISALHEHRGSFRTDKFKFLGF